MKTVNKISPAATVLLLVIFSASRVVAQGTSTPEVPPTVLQAFAGAYPGIKDIAWNQNESNFEAHFKLNGKRMELYLDNEGNVNEIKKEIMECELPVDVSTMLVKQYCEWSVSRAFHIETEGTAYYEAVIVKDQKAITLVFERNGELLMTLIE